MKYCIHCGSEIPDEAEFCKNCGKRVKVKQVSGKSVTKKPLIIGCSIVLVLIVVVGLFATGVFGGKRKAGLYDSDGNMVRSWQELLKEGTVTVSDGSIKAFGNSREHSSLENHQFMRTQREERLKGELIIKDDVTSIDDGAFAYCKNLRSIMLPDSINTIGTGAFKACENLSDITIQGNISSIGEYAFYKCRSLSSVTIPNGVTSIGNGTFQECRNLTSITIPEGVKSIGLGAFRECDSLTSITIPDSVISIENDAFHDVSLIIYDGNATGCPWNAEKVQKSDGTVRYKSES